MTERLRAMDEAQAAAAGREGRRFGQRKPAAPARPEGRRTGPALRTESPRAGATRDPYDRSTAVSSEGECGVVSRT
ncbi:hypothetical protein ACH4KU_22015 [Streptomyces althioticus]|uniref:hypothetical protein n=1 Tax=Streptomyces TaxID=1883 RepID=UPI0036FA5830